MPIYPRLLDVDALPAPDKPGHVALWPRGLDPSLRQERRVTLSAATFMVARQFDGRVSAADLVEILKAKRLNLPGPEFVVGLAEMLAEVGMAALSDAPLSGPPTLVAAGPLKQRCVGCGRSCEGHEIGPLEPTFLDTVADVHARLAEVYPDLAALPEVVQTIEEGGVERHFMVRRAGEACVFLGEDRRCRIHAHLGAEAKPLACRYFPLQIVRVEEGHRVGTTECFEAHKTFGEAEVTPETITGMGAAQMVFSDRRGLHNEAPARMLTPLPDSTGWENWSLERELLSFVEGPDFSLEGLFSFMGGVQTRPDLFSPGSPFLEMLTERIRRCGRAAMESLGEEGLVGSAGSFFEARAQLLVSMSSFEPRATPTLGPEQLEYVRHVLRDWFYLRNWHRHPSVGASLASLALGVAFAAWCAQEAAEEGLGDVFGHRLVAWSRHFHSTRDLRELFSGPEDLRAFIVSLSAAPD